MRKELSKKNILETPVNELLKQYSFLENFLKDNNLIFNENLSINEYFNTLEEETIEDFALNADDISEKIIKYIQDMMIFLGETQSSITKLSIFPGQDKNGQPENFDRLDINAGDVVSIVGPTGSGKSRLLADIEWVAQGDTPTHRKIFLNDQVPDNKWRFSTSEKLVAQLSQNMNFVMDLNVNEFLELHLKSRMETYTEDTLSQVITKANELSGEKFSANTPVTSLSGGQSRALMIADTALICKSPVILIDEIENAGIDRKKALKVLLDNYKIVLMATHDPILALMAHKRLVIKNGGISKIITNTESERKILTILEEYDEKIQNFRDLLRTGKILI